MEPFGHFDIIAYILLLYVYILKDYGPFELINILLTKLPWITVYNYITYRIWLPFPYQDLFSQQSTDVEYMFVQLLKYYFYRIENQIYGKVLFDGRLFGWVNSFRRWRYCNDGLGDITIKGVGKGLCIYSKSRNIARKHDIGIFYVHGGGFGFGKGTGHMYSEYLSLLCLNLLHQGFENPLIFVVNYHRNMKYHHQMNHLLKCLQYFQENLLRDKSVLMADSTGTTLAMLLMQEITKNNTIGVGTPFKKLKPLNKPKLLILISPMFNIFGPRKAKSNNDDYINEKVLTLWRDRYFSSADDLGFSNLDDLSLSGWEQILTDMVITYGSEEYLAEEIERFLSQFQSLTTIKMRVQCYKGRVHNWPILGFYSERTVDKREFSIQFYGAFIARTMLCDTIYQSTSYPLNINARDEDFT